MDIWRRCSYLLAAGLLLLLAAWFRFGNLADRPVHGDEANQAMKAGILLETGEYRYDPHEHHGPTLYYLTLPVLWSAGVKTIQEANIVHFRLVPAFFGLLVVAGTFLFARWLGRWAVLWAAAFTAISHSMVFYSQYYVQEMLFVCFALCFVYVSFRFAETLGLGWAIALGASAGLLHATKETCVLVFLAWGAAAMVALLGVWRQGALSGPNGVPAALVARRVMLALAVAAAVSFVLFSSFFTWWRGPLDSLLTYGQYVQRAEGEGSTALHEQPFWYYFHLLGYTYREVGPRWTEAPVLLLALAGTLASFLQRAPAPGRLHVARLLAVYGWGLALLLSLIPYKTPWNLLIFHQPLILLAGYGASRLCGWVRPRWLTVIPAALITGAILLMARQTALGITMYHADVRNPYVYAHPSSSLVRMVQRIGEIEAIAPPEERFIVHIIKPDGDYWPLPWYLRHLEHVGYWQQIPRIEQAAILVTDAGLHEILEPHFPQPYFVQMYSLRPNVLLHLYIRQDLWDAFMADRQ